MNADVATPPGGLGLKLVRAYADELGYRDDGVHNRITLKFRSEAPQAPRIAPTHASHCARMHACSSRSVHARAISIG